MGVWTPGPGATPGDDVFVGDDFDDLAEGLGGNDVLTGNGGFDWLDGGAGDDVLHGGVADFALHGGDGFDTLSLTFTADQSGLVFMNGGGVVAGDSLFGGMVIRDANVGGFVEATEVTGIEFVILFAAGDLQYGGTNVTDVATALGFADLEGLAGDDILTAGDQGGVLDGGDGDDHLTGGAGAEILIGGAGADLIEGGAGSDTVAYGRIDDTPASAITINLTAGTASGGHATGDVLVDVENIFGTEFDDTLIGDDEDNTLTAQGGANVVAGGGGADVLGSGAGVDQLNGGDGDDLVTGGAGADQLDGGEGFDIVSYFGFGSAAVQVDLSTHTASGGDAEGDVISNFEGVFGSSGHDTLTGDGAANTLSGDTGNDTLNGGGGDDTLDGGNNNDVIDAGDGDDFLHGGDGDDAMHGGDGVDTISYDSVQFFRLTLSLETGVMSWSDFHSEVDTFTSIENVRGTLANDTLTGDSGANVLQGVDGNDNLQGRDGDDRLEGGFGNDMLLGEAGADQLFGGDGNDTMTGGAGADAIDGGLGIDFVSYSGVGVTINLTTGVFTGGDAEGDTFVSIEGVNGTASADSLTGDGALNVFSGAGGDDTLVGGGGNDALTGGAGADALDGGDGEDQAIFQTAVVVSLLAPGENTGEAAGDTFISIESLTGGSGADTFTGDAGFNRLSGGSGDDTLNGEGGDDRLRGGAGADTMNGGAGTDTVDYSTEFFGPVFVDLNAGTATDGFGATDTLSSVENAIGSTFNDVLLGAAAANDALSGGAGNDILDGHTGADAMTGGAGDDSYVVDDAGDTIVEDLGGGFDTVQSSLTRTLGANVENLTLNGFAVVNGFGNELDNILLGNSAGNQLNGFDGADFLDGGEGADAMFGGNGDDLYVVDDAGDLTTEVSALGGTDTVASYVSRNLTANIENLTLIGFDPITGAGNALNNVITGNDAGNTLYGLNGNDRLDGGFGADTLFGANGNDIYIVDDIGDITVEGSALGGVDTVFSSISRNLNANFENLVLTGFAELGYGNVSNNLMVGNAFANSLYGFGGDDILNGAGEADNMFGGDGNDTYIVNNAGDITSEVSALGGTDTVMSSVTRNLTAHLENLVLTGGDTIAGAGNALDNVVTGNSAANTLFGLDGADTLDGGLGADTLQGGAGADEYVFSTALGAGNVDTVVNFNVVDDVIGLDADVFTGLAAGALAASAFHVGAAATDAAHRIVYDSTTGALYFDADGNGAGAAVQFATLGTGLALTSADFIVGGP